MDIEADDPLAFLTRGEPGGVALHPEARAKSGKKRRTPWRRWAFRAGILACHLALVLAALAWAGVLTLPVSIVGGVAEQAAAATGE